MDRRQKGDSDRVPLSLGREFGVRFLELNGPILPLFPDYKGYTAGRQRSENADPACYVKSWLIEELRVLIAGSQIVRVIRINGVHVEGVGPKVLELLPDKAGGSFLDKSPLTRLVQAVTNCCKAVLQCTEACSVDSTPASAKSAEPAKFSKL